MRPDFRGLPWLMVTRFSQVEGGTGVAHVWCPFCHTEHLHGSAGGHRTAHCQPGSPLHTAGYVLVAPKVLVKALSEAERSDWKGYTR